VLSSRNKGPVSIEVPLSARLSLLPAKRRVKFGEARARASFIKKRREVKIL